MSPDLTLLAWATALMFGQTMLASFGAMRQLGAARLAGNRENLPPVEGWAGRAQRAQRNMLENIVLFSVLVLVAHLAGRANATTALGAALFFWARLIYVPVYLFGVPYLRTIVWVVSVVGLVMIFVQVV